MSCLLDVSLMAACAWENHERHVEAKIWLRGLARFFTCSVTQMGFLRISMSAGYLASFDDAREALAVIVLKPAHAFFTDGTTGRSLPKVTSHRHVTDAHLVTLAAANAVKLATLDEQLCRAAWARDIAFNRLSNTRKTSV